MFDHRPLFALITASSGVLAALTLSSATAVADSSAADVTAGGGVWEISPDTLFSPPTIVSVSGMPPFDQTVLEQGGFDLTHVLPDSVTYADVTGQLSSTSMFGMTNDDFVTTSLYTVNAEPVIPEHSVFDIMTIGSFQNIYVDLPGLGANGANEITDTLVTPFGNFDIPTTFDAAEFGTTALPGAAIESVSSGFSAALESDWTTLVADFSALF